MNLFTSTKCIWLCLQLSIAASFIPGGPQEVQIHGIRCSPDAPLFFAKPSSSPDDDNSVSNSYESSATVIKGIVSSLTSISNFFSLRDDQSELSEQTATKSQLLDPPKTAGELLERIRADYTVNNYLWTGKLDTSAFTPNCKFTDPTISFEGINKYVQNVGNLVPIVEFLLGNNVEQNSQSKLLEISSTDLYIETRWNMIGGLNALPWKPKVDVIGRTKFWYAKGDDEAVRVYFYDEEWEIPAGMALLQFVTPANTIANSNAK
jgi:hypothetical protein